MNKEEEYEYSVPVGTMGTLGTGTSRVSTFLYFSIKGNYICNFQFTPLIKLRARCTIGPLTFFSEHLLGRFHHISIMRMCRILFISSSSLLHISVKHWEDNPQFQFQLEKTKKKSLILFYLRLRFKGCRCKYGIIKSRVT